MKKSRIEWSKIQLIIFDVDGTLYHQSSLRKLMMFSIIKFFICHPLRIKEFFILKKFRKDREKLMHYTGNNVLNYQYSLISKRFNIPLQKVDKIIHYWMIDYPLKYIYKTSYKQIKSLFELLRNKGIYIGIFSDYPVKKKVIDCLGLTPDVMVCSTDKDVDRLKPDPKGVLKMIKEFKVDANNVILIGDRDDLDGLCARNAGVDFLHISSKKSVASLIFDEIILRINELK